MTLTFDIVTIDSPLPLQLAGFWSSAFHLQVLEQEDGDRWVLLGDADGVRRLGIQRGLHRVGGVHLDLRCDEAVFTTEVDRLLSLGARAIGPARREPYGWIANLVDPDGNPFDLCAYLHG